MNRDRVNFSLDRFTVSVSNDHFHDPQNNGSSNINSFDGNAMISHRIKQVAPSTKSRSVDLCAPMKNLSFIPPKKEIFIDLTDEPGSPSDDWGHWLIKPVIRYEAFKQQVHILGVQSGHAVVTGVKCTVKNQFLKSKNPTSVFPGDIILWQPPFQDEQRPKGFVDVGTVFPVTVIKMLTSTDVMVRVLGLITILEVSLLDLFEMPKSPGDVSKIFQTIPSRNMTILTLAVIPNDTILWNSVACTGVFSVVSSLDEGGAIFERSVDQGSFFNVTLMNFIHENMAVHFDVKKRKLFMRRLTDTLERCKRAMLPTYRRLMSDQEASPEGMPLCRVSDVEGYKGKMLIGCEKILGHSEGKSLKGFKEYELRRLRFSHEKGSFYGVDDQSADITGPGKGPLQGIYVVNELFVRSVVVKDDPLRLKAAMLLSMPSLMDLGFKLNVEVL